MLQGRRHSYNTTSLVGPGIVCAFTPRAKFSFPRQLGSKGMATASLIIVLGFGLLICGLSVWGVYAPRKLVALVRRVVDEPSGIYFAVGVRVVMGVALIIAAPRSQFPRVFEVVGWITLAAAVGLVFVGQDRIRRLIAWFEGFPTAVTRVWLVFGIAFGAFLVLGVY